MNRRLRHFSLVLIALSLLAGASASSASAIWEFHAESAPVIWEGTQTENQTITLSSGTVKCQTVTLKGTGATTTSSSATLHPQYEKCTAFGLAATFNTTPKNGKGETKECNYQLTQLGIPTEKSVDLVTWMDFVCPESLPITITVAALPCTISISPQSGLSEVKLTNAGTGTTRDITAALNLTGISYSETGAGCLGSGGTTGKYTGTVTIKGYKDSGGTKGAQQGIWVE